MAMNSDPSTDQLNESDLKQRQIELRERELKLKEAELARPIWRNPVLVGLIAAALGLLGNLVATYLQNRNAQQLERYKTQSNLILEAIKTGDQENAAKNLTFFLQLGFIDDKQGKIEAFLNKKADLPVLPSASTNHVPSDHVRIAKLALTALGMFAGNADDYESETFRDAVRKFQADHQMPADGVLDDDTYNAILISVKQLSIKAWPDIIRKRFGGALQR